ncbi:MAG TPA: hypothetical protein VD969_10350 [Symbiobacteriaceae bacterium]|nr:hypothetical protein [Symbiobacteriaceae bacterium]
MSDEGPGAPEGRPLGLPVPAKPGGRPVRKAGDRPPGRPVSRPGGAGPGARPERAPRPAFKAGAGPGARPERAPRPAFKAGAGPGAGPGRAPRPAFKAGAGPGARPERAPRPAFKAGAGPGEVPPPAAPQDPLAEAKARWQPALRWCQKELREAKFMDAAIRAAVERFHGLVKAALAAAEPDRFHQAERTAAAYVGEHAFLRWAPIPSLKAKSRSSN